MILDQNIETMARDADDAQDRLFEHFDLETQRMKAGLPTDMERYLKGEEITD